MNIKEFELVLSKNPEEAFSALSNINTALPEAYLFYIACGNFLSNNGDLEKAEWHFRKSYSLRPDNSHAATTLCKHMLAIERVEEAARILHEFVAKNGPSPTVSGLLHKIKGVPLPEVFALKDELSKISTTAMMETAYLYAQIEDWASAEECIRTQFNFQVHISRMLLTLRHRLGALALEDFSPELGPERRVFQFWDSSTVPGDVSNVMGQIEASSASYILLNDKDFVALTTKYYQNTAKRVMELASHPVSKANITRLLYLLYNGGTYIDSDMLIKNNSCFKVGDKNRIVFADSLKYPCITNWFLSSGRQEKLFVCALDYIASQPSTNKEYLTTFDLTGCGVLTHAYYEGLECESKSFVLTRESSLQPFFTYNNDLAYKQTPMNWIKAAPAKVIYISGELA